MTPINITTKCPVSACPECGGRLERGTREKTIHYRGHARTIDQPGWWCAECGEGVIAGADAAVFDRAAAALKAEIENVLAPNEVAQVRIKLGLSQREAGRVLGGGPRAFYKYERGEAVVSGPMANLLRVLYLYPKAIKALTASGLHGDKPIKIVASTTPTFVRTARTRRKSA